MTETDQTAVLTDALVAFEISDEIEDWPLSRFARSGQCLRVYSKTLDEIIILAADNAAEPNEEAVVYRAAELPSLVDRTPHAIRDMHRARKAFDGEVLENAPDGVEVPSEILLPGVVGDLYADIVVAPDDGELEAICQQLDDAFKAGELNDRSLKLLTDAVSKRAKELEVADDVEP